MLKKLLISILFFFTLCSSEVIILAQNNLIEPMQESNMQTEQLQAETSFFKSDSMIVPFIASFTAMAIMLLSWYTIDCICGRCEEQPEKIE